jgi:hypothetical protein
MFSKILNLVPLLLLLAPVLCAIVSGYLWNACKGEELYDHTTKDGHCISFCGLELADSFVVSGLSAHQEVNFYADSACTKLIHGKNTEVCYLVPIKSARVMLF